MNKSFNLKKLLFQAIILFTMIIFTISQFLTTRAESWDSTNNPLIMGQEFELNFDKLPSTAQLETIPWTDSYWPSQKGGIAYRWNDSQSSIFSNFFFFYRPTYSLRKLKRINSDEISHLSPAEKFDILNCNYNFPTYTSELRRTSPFAQSWEGICHGWAPASFVYKEPNATKIKNADGIEIPFGSSDIKALISYYVGQISSKTAKVVGNRCNFNTKVTPEMKNSLVCRDVNPGAFHVVLCNSLGLKKKGVIADLSKYDEVWNQPVFGFTTTVISSKNSASEGSAIGTVKEITVKTEIKFRVCSRPAWEPIKDNPSYIKVQSYQYVLEINNSGQILGGRWISEDHPDFIWSTDIRPEFNNKFKNLEKLYNKSIQ